MLVTTEFKLRLLTMTLLMRGRHIYPNHLNVRFLMSYRNVEEKVRVKWALTRTTS